MITTWSTVWATSARTWLETSTVRPWSARWRRSPRSQWMPSGSRPLAGSSRTSTAEALAHAEREATHPPPGRVGQADLVEDLVGPRERQAGGGGDHAQVVAGGPARVEARGLEQGADVAARVGELPVGPAVDPGGAGGRGDQAEQHAQGGGLAGPVGAEKACHGALVDLEAEVVDGDDVAEALGESLDGDDGHGVLLAPSASAGGHTLTVLTCGGTARSASCRWSARTASAALPMPQAAGTTPLSTSTVPRSGIRSSRAGSDPPRSAGRPTRHSSAHTRFSSTGTTTRPVTRTRPRGRRAGWARQRRSSTVERAIPSACSTTTASRTKKAVWLPDMAGSAVSCRPTSRPSTPRAMPAIRMGDRALSPLASTTMPQRPAGASVRMLRKFPVEPGCHTIDTPLVCPTYQPMP